MEIVECRYFLITKIVLISLNFPYFLRLWKITWPSVQSQDVVELNKSIYHLFCLVFVSNVQLQFKNNVKYKRTDALSLWHQQ